MPGLLEHQRLVVSQKAKIIELTNEYLIRDEDGNEVGAVRQENQSRMRKALRLVSKFDQFLTHHLSVYDAGGAKVLGITRPAALLKSTVEVTGGSGQPVGRIVQQNVVGRIRFALLDAGGEPLGEIRGENWRSWDFAIVDSSEREVARVTKKWRGLGREMFTTADSYAVEISPDLTGTLRLLAFAAAVSIDTALKQDAG